jgi:hypothetical protein
VRQSEEIAMTQTARHPSARQPSRLVMARSRGALVGTLLVLLGAWGALIPYIGHSFGYGYTPDGTWTWTAGRFWLELLPGAVTMVCGWLIATSGSRATGMLAGWMAAAAGAWFVLGTVVSPLWSSGFNGVPSGNAHHGVYEQAGMFAGLGVAIVFLAAVAIGRFSVVGVRDIAVGRARMERQVPPIAAPLSGSGDESFTVRPVRRPTVVTRPMAPADPSVGEEPTALTVPPEWVRVEPRETVNH